MATQSKSKSTPAKADKSNPAPSLGVFPIYTMAQLDAMDLSGSLKLAKFADDTQRAAYMTIGKVMVRLRNEQFKKGESIASLFRDAGIKESTINNARYFARAFTPLVLDQHMAEPAFDAIMGYTECYAVVRVMDSKLAKRSFTAKEAAAYIVAHPDTFADEFESFIAYGMTVAEKLETDKETPPPAAGKQAAAPVAPVAPVVPATPATTAATVSSTTNPLPNRDSVLPVVPPAPEVGKIVPLPPVSNSAKPTPLPEDATKLVGAVNSLIGDCDDVATLRTLAKALALLAETATGKADDVELEQLESEQPATAIA